MVVGGLVAFFVPRYYVAETTIKYSGYVLEPNDGTIDDPMLGVVAAARLTIPATVPIVLEELAWPEALDEDEDARRGFEAAVRSQLQVLDLNVDTRGSKFASLKISYRDTRADRVAAFPNMLRDMWIVNQETRLTERANLERQQPTQQMQGATRDLNNARRELRQYQQQNRINPIEGARGEARESSRLSDEHRDVEAREQWRVGRTKYSGDTPGVIARNFRTGEERQLIEFGASHTSTRNIFGRPLAILSYHKPSNSYLRNEIVGACIDGSCVERYAHTHRASDGRYLTESQASVSPYGDRIVFRSNWDEEGGPINAYVIELSGRSSSGLGSTPETTPTVTITAPESGSSFDEGNSIAFIGTANDAEDGDLTASLTWSSDRDVL